MTQEILNKAEELKTAIDKYEIAIRYAMTNFIRFSGMIGEVTLSEDKELAKLIYDHCKAKQDELIKEYREL